MLPVNLAKKMEVTKLHTFTGHRDCVYALENDALPHRFFSAAGDGMVVRWNLEQPDQGELIARVPASVYALCHVPQDGQLWIGQNFDGLHMIDLDTKKETKSIKITASAIFDIKTWLSTVGVATGDGAVVFLDKETFSVRKTIRLSDKSARCLAVNPVGGEVAVGYSDHAIRIFDWQTLQPKHTIAAHGNSVFALHYSPDFRWLLSGGRDARLKVWDAAAGYAPHTSVVAHTFAINHIVYRADGQQFATCSMDKSIKIWDAATFRLLKVIDKARHAGHATSINKLLWTGYQNQLVSASDDRSLSVWSLENN